MMMAEYTKLHISRSSYPKSQLGWITNGKWWTAPGNIFGSSISKSPNASQCAIDESPVSCEIFVSSVSFLVCSTQEVNWSLTYIEWWSLAEPAFRRWPWLGNQALRSGAWWLSTISIPALSSFLSPSFRLSFLGRWRVIYKLQGDVKNGHPGTLVETYIGWESRSSRGIVGSPATRTQVASPFVGWMRHMKKSNNKQYTTSIWVLLSLHICCLCSSQHALHQLVPAYSPVKCLLIVL